MGQDSTCPEEKPWVDQHRMDRGNKEIEVDRTVDFGRGMIVAVEGRKGGPADGGIEVAYELERIRQTSSCLVRRGGWGVGGRRRQNLLNRYRYR
jgi:hypothetical protein